MTAVKKLHRVSCCSHRFCDTVQKSFGQAVLLVKVAAEAGSVVRLVLGGH